MAAVQATAGMSAEAASSGNEGLKHHVRTYQACIPCRRRKVRCDLGSVDAPSDPPCMRCRRESKDCFFSATRRKRRNGSGEEEDNETNEVEYATNNQRKRTRASHGEVTDTPTTSSIPASLPTYAIAGNNLVGPLTPGGNVGIPHPLRPTSSSATQNPKTDDEDNERVNNETAAHLQRGEIFGGHDALNLLATTAGLHHRTGSMNSARPSVSMVNTPGSFTSLASPQTSGPFPPLSHHTTRDSTSHSFSQLPMLSRLNGSDQIDPTYAAALRVWANVHFVNIGWFTGEEGIRYINYFYEHIAPLTPVAVSDYRDLSKHAVLVDTEPMLALAMLTIASRYMDLSGLGAKSRSSAIHTYLWNFLQNNINHIIWGQDQLSGTFYGLRSQPGSDVNPLLRTGLRTLGTVEGLMTLTEWHPRALHFPPSGDSGEILVSKRQTNTVPVGNGNQHLHSWLEPCWRSDRMCWSLLGIAFHLAVEIGVFDNTSKLIFRQENRNVPAAEVDEYFARKAHLRDLLTVYITQTSGRLGLTSMLPKTYMADAFTDFMFSDFSLDERRTERISRVAAANMENLQLVDSQEATLPFWIEIAMIMHTGNQQMFPSRRVTRELIRKGEYVTLLQSFEPMLDSWRSKFEACDSIPQVMRHILKIEFEYARIYLHSLALQAVVERCTHNSPPMTNSHDVGGSASPDKDSGSIPPHVLNKWIGGDRRYIEVIVDACRNVLKVVNDGMFPNGSLKHLPVRTCFRIVSVIIILLKTFALGAFEKDVEVSLGLVDKAVECLSTSVVDDVHVINSFTELATILTQRLRSRLVRLATNGGTVGRSPVVASASNHALGRELPPMGPPGKSKKTRTASQNATAMQWSNAFGNGNGNSSHETYEYQLQPHSNSPLGFHYNGRSNPLFGISTHSYDPGTNNVSIVPPPSFGSNGAYNPQLSNDNFGYTTFGNGESGDQSDWLTLPLDNLFTNHHGVDVTQTTYGPDVGGMDLLDVLLDPQTGPVSFH